MPVMIQVRNVPDALHRELVRRAEARGMSLTAYVQSILEREISRMPLDEVVDRLRELPPSDLTEVVVEEIRARRGPLTGDDPG